MRAPVAGASSPWSAMRASARPARARSSRALLLGTYRERHMRSLPRLLGEVVRVGERVPLPGLELAEVGEFVRRASSDTPLKDALIARLHQVTHGNPFFLDELVRMLRA